ncbi:hypothetical protein SESBI_33443 [Sesbania bispinosa]|nr:hypothetical protein SESBI_33443 [Sesbania bispinosa]
MADLQQKLDALKGLVGVLNSMDDGETQNATPPSNPHPTPVPGRNRSFAKYNNTGHQNIKGLSNQTGFTEGNANGAINFGSLHA